MLLVQIAGGGAGDVWRQRCARTVQGRTQQAEARAECAGAHQTERRRRNRNDAVGGQGETAFARGDHT